MRAVVFLLVLTGCAVELTPFRGPNGRVAYAMDCSDLGIEACYQKAGEVCPNGYDILGQSDNVASTGKFLVSHARLAIECRS